MLTKLLNCSDDFIAFLSGTLICCFNSSSLFLLVDCSRKKSYPIPCSVFSHSHLKKSIHCFRMLCNFPAKTSFVSIDPLPMLQIGYRQRNVFHSLYASLCLKFYDLIITVKRVVERLNFPHLVSQAITFPLFSLL